LNGYIIRGGKTFGIPTPVNEIITALIKAITGPVPAGPAVLRLDGEVIQPIVLDVEALSKLPDESQVSDIDPLGQGMRGVRVKALLDVATPALGVDHVTFHSADGKFAASLSLKQAVDTGVLIYLLDGKPLSADAGGPFRLLTPGLGDLCANVKSVSRMEFTKGPGKDTRPSLPNFETPRPSGERAG
jgi:2-dehydropantoate 2-reductase